ncbi:MAG: hypothetical protein M3326_16745 [Actinomycetota bacterium]|nr:hypothetical protein [Actinomycetota bacterium]
MVQIVPNWADLEGEVVGVEPSDRLPDFTVVRVRVEKVTPVEGYADLLENCRGQVVAVLVRNEVAAAHGVDLGAHITCRARRADHRTVFAHPTLFETRGT